MSAVEVRSLGVAFGAAEILHDVSLALAGGSWAAVIGPNGAGKSTLLRAIAGLVGSSGAIMLAGADARALSRRERARRVALVPQSPVVPPEMTVREYVLLGRSPYLGYFASESRRDIGAAETAIERLELTGLAARPLSTLSGGELQRAVLARALAQEAEIVLLDEPTSSLDIGRQQYVLELVDAVRREDGLTVVAAMHDLTLAGQYAARVFLLDRGTVVAAGTPEQVLRAELLSRHYGAGVRVVADGSDLLVLPARRLQEAACAR